jgi:hypothetical protein
MVNHVFKPGQTRALLRALALLLASTLFWSSHAGAAPAPAKSPAHKTKAGKHTATKTSATKTTATKTNANCPAIKNLASRRRCLAANAQARKAAPPAVTTPVPAIAAVPAAAVATAAAAPGAPSPCFAALAASQASQNMAAKVPFFAGQAPGPATLANPEHPSKKEQGELSSLIAGYQMCQEMSAPPGAGSEQGPQPRLDDAQWRASKAILDSLKAGKLSYGAAAHALANAEQRSGALN